MALKQLNHEKGDPDEEDHQKRLLVEAAAQFVGADVVGPFLPTLFGFAVQLDKFGLVSRLGIVMEVVEGPTLKEWLNQASIGLEQKWRFVQLLLVFLVLKCLLRIEHGDMHAENIKVVSRRAPAGITWFVPVILDFGLARVNTTSTSETVPRVIRSEPTWSRTEGTILISGSHGTESGFTDRFSFVEHFNAIFGQAIQDQSVRIIRHQMKCSSNVPLDNDLSYFATLLHCMASTDMDWLMLQGILFGFSTRHFDALHPTLNIAHELAERCHREWQQFHKLIQFLGLTDEELLRMTPQQLEKVCEILNVEFNSQVKELVPAIRRRIQEITPPTHDKSAASSSS